MCESGQSVSLDEGPADACVARGMSGVHGTEPDLDPTAAARVVLAVVGVSGRGRSRAAIDLSPLLERTHCSEECDRHAGYQRGSAARIGHDRIIATPEGDLCDGPWRHAPILIFLQEVERRGRDRGK